MSEPTDPSSTERLGTETEADEVPEVPRTVQQLRRDAVFQDGLLFACAFTAGALAFGLLRALLAAFDEGADDWWSIGLSDDLIFVGLLTGEAFLLWNNGIRQGLRGHSIGKHRVGLAVVDADSQQPTGAVRGLIRGAVVVLLLDLSLAALPVGLPTALRRLTPDSWHLGFVTYLAVAIVVIPLLVSVERRLADRVAGTVVVETGARTSRRRGVVVAGLEAIGVIGVLGLAVAYIAFYSPLIRFPDLF